MPAASTIVLNDGTNDRNFVPVAVSAEKSVFTSRHGATSAGCPVMVLGFDGAKPSRLTNKVQIRLNVPKEYLDSDTGLYLVKSTARVNTEVVIPDDWTADERAAFWNLYQGASANAVVSGYVDSLEPTW